MNETQKLEYLRRLIEQQGDTVADVKFLVEIVDRQERRIQELFHANNDLVEKRRMAEGRSDYYQSAMEFMIKHGISAATMLRQADGERRVLRSERDAAIADARAGWHDSEQRLVEIGQLREETAASTAIVTRARAWYQAIISLNTAKPKEKLLANQNYTRAHIALKQIFATRNPE